MQKLSTLFFGNIMAGLDTEELCKREFAGGSILDCLFIGHIAYLITHQRHFRKRTIRVFFFCIKEAILMFMSFIPLTFGLLFFDIVPVVYLIALKLVEQVERSTREVEHKWVTLF